MAQQFLKPIRGWTFSLQGGGKFSWRDRIADLQVVIDSLPEGRHSCLIILRRVYGATYVQLLAQQEEYGWVFWGGIEDVMASIHSSGVPIIDLGSEIWDLPDGSSVEVRRVDGAGATTLEMGDDYTDEDGECGVPAEDTSE